MLPLTGPPRVADSLVWGPLSSPGQAAGKLLEDLLMSMAVVKGGLEGPAAVHEQKGSGLARTLPLRPGRRRLAQEGSEAQVPGAGSLFGIGCLQSPAGVQGRLEPVAEPGTIGEHSDGKGILIAERPRSAANSCSWRERPCP